MSDEPGASSAATRHAIPLKPATLTILPFNGPSVKGSSGSSSHSSGCGKLDFGPWEQIFYGEFDGRRRKRVLVKIIGE